MPINDVNIGSDVGILYPDLVNIYGCRIEDGSRIGAKFIHQITLADGKGGSTSRYPGLQQKK